MFLEETFAIYQSKQWILNFGWNKLIFNQKLQTFNWMY
jgi:hypothetical protein